MHSVTCPSCGQEIPLDADSFAHILEQVRNEAFEAEVANRTKAERERHEAQVKLAVEEERSKAAGEVSELRATHDAELAKEKENAAQRIADLEAKLSAERQKVGDLEEKAQAEKNLALEKEKRESAIRINALKADLKAEQDKRQSVEREAEIAQKLAIAEQTRELERERDRLAGAIQLEKEKAERERAEFEKRIEQAEREHQAIVRIKDDELERIRDMRARQSTKMVGESLELHCEAEFNKVRAYAFPRAEFHKDTEAVEGTKGDFIFREADENGVELLSIMFEMKNETESGSRKLRNENHFAKLDADRKKKKCEYAILVSLLEPDNEFYNQGIVEAPGFEKMYVIRPQFFVPIIGLLRNMALRSLASRLELEQLKERDQDLTHFEDKLNQIRIGIMDTVTRADRSLEQSVEAIDKAIKDLQNAKQRLQTTRKHLGTADNKAQDLTARKLTWGNKTMQAKLKEARELAAAGGEGGVEVLAAPRSDQKESPDIESVEILDVEVANTAQTERDG